MKLRIFQVDAFTRDLFAGNPAAVLAMESFAPEATMQAIAAENNLAETAFLVPKGSDYKLRWFTPETEVPLCGHATLASAAVVMKRLEPGRSHVVFHTASGALTVSCSGEAYVMDFPTRPSQLVATPAGLGEALGSTPTEVWANSFNYMAIFGDEQTVRNLSPDMAAIAQIDRPGVIVTAKGKDTYDFVSRYFAPRKGIPEDPVTGAAHCMLAPYWAKQLGKLQFKAYQASRRGGEIVCRILGERIELEGYCVFYLEGEVEICA